MESLWASLQNLFGLRLFIYEELPITSDSFWAGYILKKSSKSNGWSKKWFVLNEKTAKVSNIAGTLDTSRSSDFFFSYNNETC